MKNTALNPRAAWPFPSRLVVPHTFIEYNGERWIEVEWPSDDRYDCGYQLAYPLHGSMRLFELASRRLPQSDVDSREPQNRSLPIIR